MIVGTKASDSRFRPCNAKSIAFSAGSAGTSARGSRTTATTMIPLTQTASFPFSEINGRARLTYYLVPAEPADSRCHDQADADIS